MELWFSSALCGPPGSLSTPSGHFSITKHSIGIDRLSSWDNPILGPCCGLRTLITGEEKWTPLTSPSIPPLAKTRHQEQYCISKREKAETIHDTENTKREVLHLHLIRRPHPSRSQMDPGEWPGDDKWKQGAVPVTAAFPTWHLFPEHIHAVTTLGP